MYCSKCGGVMSDDAAFCSNCGQAFAVAAAVARAPMMSSPVAAPTAGGVATVPAYAGYAAISRVEYAGFWVRFLAFLIDNAVVGIGFVLILIPLIFLTGLGGFIGEIHPNEDMNDVGIFMLFGLLFLAATASLLLTWLYHALMESSEWQATLGKKVLGLVVTDMARQLRPRDGEALCQDHHQHGACIYRIHHGRIYGKKAGAARHDRGMPGAAAKQLRKNSGSSRSDGRSLLGYATTGAKSKREKICPPRFSRPWELTPAIVLPCLIA